MLFVVFAIILNGALWLWWYDAWRRISIFMKRNVLGDNAPVLPPGHVGFPIIGELPFLLLTQGKDKLGNFRANRERQFGEIYCTALPPLINHGIVICSEDGVKWILSKENRGVDGEWDRATTSLLGMHSVAVLTGKAHKRMRSVLLPVFQPTFLRQYALAINDIVKDHFRVEWSPSDGKPTSRLCTHKSMKKLAFKIIATLVIGLDPEKDLQATRDLMDLMERWFKGLFMPPYWFPGNPFSKAMKARETMKSMLLRAIRERRQSIKAEKFDVLGLLLQPRKSETGDEIVLTDNEIFDSLLTMLFAGTDTSSCAGTWIVQHLYENPATLSRLREEHIALRRSRKDHLADRITWDEMESLRYTNQVIFEALRMHAPVAGGFRRVTKDLVYKGYLIPKGYKVAFDLNTMTRNQQYHKNVGTFNPNRFESDQAMGGLSKEGFIPFGSGARMCIGYRLAMTELNVMIHHLVLKYSWESDSAGEVSYFPMPVPADGYPVVVKNYVPTKGE